MKQETLFVFVTAQGRVMARLSDGTIADVTDYCDLLPRQVCKGAPKDAYKDTHKICDSQAARAA